MLLSITAAVLIIDQITKFLVLKNLQYHESIALIRGVFHLTLIVNKGAAFGIFKGGLFIFISAAIFAVTLIFLDLKKKGLGDFSLYNISLALILGGALGNLMDRLRFGYVVDFLDFRIWPVFNIADTSITIGAILLGWSLCIRSSAK